MKTVIHNLVVLVLLVSLPLITTTAYSAPLQQSTGAISGQVRAADGGAPLAGIEVCVTPNSGGTYACATSNAAGVYTVGGLVTGNYSIGIKAAGWAVKYYVDASYIGGADHLQVVAGQTLGGIDFDLEPGGSISGVVRNESGTPLEGAYIRLDVDYETYTACTDGSGMYTINAITYEGYGFLRASVDDAVCPNSLPDYAYQYWQTADTIDDVIVVDFLDEDFDFQNLNFTLPLGGSISGTVTDSNTGLPLSGAEVCTAFEMDASCSQTGPDGAYTISRLPAYDEFYVRASAGGYALEYYNGVYNTRYRSDVSVSSGATTSGIDFQLAPGGSISGMVTGPTGDPVQGVSITANGLSTVTASDGSYQIDDLPLGHKFFVYAHIEDQWGQPLYAPEYWANQHTNRYDEITLTDSIPTRTDIDFAMEEMGVISGTLRAFSGEPLPDRGVCASQSYMKLECVDTDIYGGYRLRVVPYSYYIYTYDTQGQRLYYDDPQTSTEEDIVYVDPGETVTGIDLFSDPCFSASDGSSLDGVNLSWCADTGAAYYAVYRTPTGGQAEFVDNTTGTEYTDTGANALTHYTYALQSCDAQGCRDFSTPDTGWRNQAVGAGEYDDGFNGFGYDGNWDLESNAAALNGTLSVSHYRDNALYLFFEGRCASIHYMTSGSYGTIKVYIDGVEMARLRQYIPENPAPMQSMPLCVEEGLHTLLIDHYMGNPVSFDAVSIDPPEYSYHMYAPLSP